MTVSQLKNIKDTVYVTFKYSKSGVSQYYNAQIKSGKIVGKLNKLHASYQSSGIDVSNITTLDELVETIKNYSFTRQHFSIHLIDGAPADLYNEKKSLETTINQVKSIMEGVYVKFLTEELMSDLNKCNYVQICDEPINRVSKNKNNLLYKLNCKSYTFLLALGLTKRKNLTEEWDTLIGTEYLDTIIYKSKLDYKWLLDKSKKTKN